MGTTLGLFAFANIPPAPSRCLLERIRVPSLDRVPSVVQLQCGWDTQAAFPSLPRSQEEAGNEREEGGMYTNAGIAACPRCGDAGSREGCARRGRASKKIHVDRCA